MLVQLTLIWGDLNGKESGVLRWCNFHWNTWTRKTMKWKRYVNSRVAWKPQHKQMLPSKQQPCSHSHPPFKPFQWLTEVSESKFNPKESGLSIRNTGRWQDYLNRELSYKGISYLLTKEKVLVLKLANFRPYNTQRAPVGRPSLSPLCHSWSVHFYPLLTSRHHSRVWVLAILTSAQWRALYSI